MKYKLLIIICVFILLTAMVIAPPPPPPPTPGGFGSSSGSTTGSNSGSSGSNSDLPPTSDFPGSSTVSTTQNTGNIRNQQNVEATSTRTIPLTTEQRVTNLENRSIFFSTPVIILYALNIVMLGIILYLLSTMQPRQPGM